MKAQLVANGYTQTYDVDYFETFSPIARLNSVHIPIPLIVNFEWSLYQLDVKNAILYGDLREEIYMEQPHEFVTQGELEVRICKLNKAIYKLKQFPWAWFDYLSTILLSFGFRRCNFDHLFSQEGK